MPKSRDARPGRKGKLPGRSSAKRAAKRIGFVRKNMDMDPAKIDALKTHYAVASETEAVDRAMAEVLGKRRVLGALGRARARGGLQDIYAPPA